MRYHRSAWSLRSSVVPLSDPDKHVFTFWIDFAKSCYFRPDRMAEYRHVSPMQFAEWFLIVAQRPLDYWLLEAQA